MNSNLNEETINTEDYRFEIDSDIVEKYKGAVKIFMSDKRSVTKISNRLLILGCFFLIITMPFTLSLTRGYHLNLYAVLNLMGIFTIYSGFHLRINALRFPLVIIYEDKILFKKKKRFLFGELRLLNPLYLYGSKKFNSIQKKDIKNISKLRSLLSTDIYIESRLNNSTVQIYLNSEKKYMEHIFLYLQAYMNDNV